MVQSQQYDARQKARKRKIFAAYLDLGSIGALANALNAEGLKPKPRQLANGGVIQAACYQVGQLAHLLKNRFYLGEVVYRGEICTGGQCGHSRSGAVQSRPAAPQGAGS